MAAVVNWSGGFKVVWVVGEPREDLGFLGSVEFDDDKQGSLSGSSWGSILVKALPPLWSDFVVVLFI